jgi:glycine hydroxymethyltransferase
MGGPLPHVMAAKSVALEQALSNEFQKYAQQIVTNSQALANSLITSNINVITNGTENHINLIDVSTLNLTGRQAESVLREAKITLNRNALPFDSNGPWYTSGLRIGTPALTSLGMKEIEMEKIAEIISMVLSETKPTVIKNKELPNKMSLAKYEISTNIITKASKMVDDILSKFPVYPEIDLEFLEKYFKR